MTQLGSDGMHLLDTAEVVLSRARRRGIDLWLDNGQLRCKAPKGVLNDEDVQSLVKHRAEIMMRLEMAIGTDAYERDLLPRPERERVPLTYCQLDFWKIMKLATERFMRHLITVTRLEGQLDLQALRESIAAVIHRQEALRIRFDIVDGTPQQRVVEWNDFTLEVDELPAYVDGPREHEAERWVLRHVSESIDVTTDPLFSARVLKEGDEQHLLLITLHHIVGDDVSKSIIVREVMTAYGQASKGLPISLPAIPIQFMDYALWQAEQSWIVKRAEYWTRRIAGYHLAHVPTEPSKRRGVGRAQARINREMMAALKAQSRRQRTTVVMSILAAYIALLARRLNLPNMVIKFTSNGRTSPRLENTVGFFTFPMYVCMTVEDNPSLSELINRAAAEYSMTLDYAGIGCTDLPDHYPHAAQPCGFNWVTNEAAVLMPEDGTRHQSLKYSPVSFDHPLWGEGAVAVEIGDLVGQPSLIIEDMKTEADASFIFSRVSHSDESMDSLARNFLSFLETLVTRPHTRIQDIPMS